MPEQKILLCNWRRGKVMSGEEKKTLVLSYEVGES
jgi:hypothetical protein